MGLLAFGVRRRRMISMLAVLLMAGLGFTMLSGCGDNAQAPVTTKATITATSGSVTQTTPLLITVQ
jgi:hypothetical protein